MQWLEKLKLLNRAYKYRYKDDIGEISFLLSTIRRGATVMDIGAHKGGYLFWMQQLVGETGKVIAFEPQLKGYEYLSKLRSLMRWDHVRVENMALSDEEAETTLYIQEQIFDVSFEASLENKYTSGVITQQIMTSTIDRYCTRHHLSPSFLKIDVEGHEWNVLKGAKETLRQFHPAILLECEARHIGEEKARACFELILSFGYKGHFIHQEELQPLSLFDFKKHQLQTGENFWKKKGYCNNFVFIY